MSTQQTETHGLDTKSTVFFYEQDFYVLSNFSAFKIKRGGILFDTSEHAYHYEKFKAPRAHNDRHHFGLPHICAAILKTRSAHEALKLAETHKELRRPDWDDVKTSIMHSILINKAEQHEYVRRKLLATGDRRLVENSWRDDYWGWGKGQDGQNMLGVLWMRVRDELRVEYRTHP